MVKELAKLKTKNALIKTAMKSSTVSKSYFSDQIDYQKNEKYRQQHYITYEEEIKKKNIIIPLISHIAKSLTKGDKLPILQNI